MRAHLWAGGPAPAEYADMLLCERFGWTIQELDETPVHRVKEFLTMWAIESQFAQPKRKGRPQEDADIQT